MQLVEKHIIKEGHKLYTECNALAFLSKNLYNKANYIIRQKFIQEEDSKYLNYYDLNRMMIDASDADYRALPAKVANGTLRLLDKNWSSFFRSIKDWGKSPEKYLGRPKLPKYKKKESGRNVVLYEKGAVSKRSLEGDSMISLSKTGIEISSRVAYEQLQAVRIVPKYGHYVIEVIYKKEEEDFGLDRNNVLGVDLGVSNLATVATIGGDSFILNGRPLKSMNQYFNKVRSDLQSKLEDDQFSSNRIKRLTLKRNNKVDNYLHRASRYLIDYCLAHNTGKIVIGNNKNWKQSISLGKRNNQNFVSIPFSRFIEMVEYKAKLVGIEVVFTEESYTSKCSFIDGEEVRKHGAYAGKRVHRGLFKSRDGLRINADVNGAYNMIRKVFPLFSASALKYGIEGLAAHPMRVTPA